jgi:CHASE2 domain-containing sensor protein
MKGSADRPSHQKTSSADGHRVNIFPRFWSWSAPLRERCALLGLILVFLIELSIVPFFENGDNSLIIWFARLFHHVDQGYTFVDVNNEAFADWGKSGHTDRSKIKELIKGIAANDPKAIVVDIDLSARIVDEADQTLRDYVLKEYSKHYTQPLIFVQALRYRSAEKDPREIADSLIKESDVEKSGGPIYFASAGFLRSADGKVRSWLLAEPACIKRPDGHEELKTIPSVELLLLPIQLENDSSKGKLHPDVINEKVQNFYFGKCGPLETTMREIELGDHKIRLSTRHLQDRIIYTKKWHSEAEREKLGDDSKYRYVNAKDFIEISEGAVVYEKDYFSSKIVVIGGSNEEGKDNYYTPYGPMPGAMILINAIESLRAYHQLSGLQTRVDITVGIIIGVVIWFFLEFLRVEMGPVVCVIGYVAALILSMVLLSMGIWFSVSGIGAGLLAHLGSKLACPVVRDILNKKPHASRAPHFRHPR